MTDKEVKALARALASARYEHSTGDGSAQDTAVIRAMDEAAKRVADKIDFDGRKRVTQRKFLEACGVDPTTF